MSKLAYRTIGNEHPQGKLTLYQKGRSMLFLFESPIKARFMNYKQVVNLTLPDKEERT